MFDAIDYGRRVFKVMRAEGVSRHKAAEIVAAKLTPEERAELIRYALVDCESRYVREGQGKEEGAGQGTPDTQRFSTRSFSFSALAAHPLEVLVPTFDGTGARIKLGDLPRDAAQHRANYFAVVRDAYAAKSKRWGEVAVKMKDDQVLRDVWDTLPRRLVDFLMDEVGMSASGEEAARSAS